MKEEERVREMEREKRREDRRQMSHEDWQERLHIPAVRRVFISTGVSSSRRSCSRKFL